MTTYKKKLIEVALPLEAINVASAREKSIRHGHPSTLHLWWARRPLAACRAVLFASLVDDPSSRPEEFPTETEQDRERQRLFKIIEDLVIWENSNNPDVLARAKAEIMKSTDGNPPPVLDPFCGGGSIPLEAQRLGLEAHASDLNPVAVLITKALIEIPPKFAGLPPVNPDARRSGLHTGSWQGASGLAEDFRYYGEWMRKEAERRIGHLYPKAIVYSHRSTGEMYSQAEYNQLVESERTLIGDPASLLPHPSDLEKQELTVIAWIWARTVKCPNPGCGARMPLVRSFALSTKVGKDVWAKPRVVGVGASSRVEFSIQRGKGRPPEGTVGRQGALCLACESPVALDYVRAEGKAKRMGAQLMATVAEGERGRVYLAPDSEHERISESAQAKWEPDQELPSQALGFRVQGYGLTRWADLFTSRQLMTLTVLSDLVSEVTELVCTDTQQVGCDDQLARGYAYALQTYLAMVVTRIAETSSTICTWNSNPQMETVRSTFARQAIPITWDYAEGNTFGHSSGSFDKLIMYMSRAIESLPASRNSIATQSDARTARMGGPYLYSTDPPYYDNVPYADLADFFHVWLRRMLKQQYPEMFSTVLTPKSSELVADPFRFGGDTSARSNFERGMTSVFTSLRNQAHRQFPLTVFYAFKQSETEETSDTDGTSQAASTGWETMLQGLIDSDLAITGTWPVRTERSARTRNIGSNALASSIVLVCRPRPDDAPIASRSEFIQALRRELEDALIKMMHGNIAPVDLAQATIGPGMAVYTRYREVLDFDGSPLRVRTALQIINQELDAILSAHEGDYDRDTRFCLAWFEQFGMETGDFGQADVLARAKDTSVQGLHDAGVVKSSGGKVRLLRRDEYAADWDPTKDARRPIWEATQYLVRALADRGESGAARVAQALGGDAEIARDLAYRLYSICERKGWAQEALAYNGLVIAWPAIMDIARNPNIAEMSMGGLFGGEEN